MRDMFRRIRDVLIAITVLVVVLWWTGLITAFWFWWGILIVLTLLPALAVPQIVARIVYLLLIVVLWPLGMHYAYKVAPRTMEATTQRAIDADIRTADGVRPVGTGMRILSAKHRQLREEQITAWYAEALAEVRSKIGQPKCYKGRNCTEAWAENEEQRILREKKHDLEAVQKVVLDPSPQERKPWQLPSLRKRAWLQILGIALVGLGAVLMVTRKGGSNAA